MKKNLTVGNFNFQGTCQSLVFLGLGLLGVIYYLLYPFSYNIILLAYLQITLAMIIGFLMRSIRRKIFFGNKISLHQSISFEIIVQLKQALNPLLPGRAFEAEFIERETGLDADKISTWLKIRVTSSYAVICLALALLMHLYESKPHYISIAFIIAATLIAVFTLILNKTNIIATILTIISGIAIWLTEGLLVVLALQQYGISSFEAWSIYLLFTVLIEISPIPFGLGVAELPLLIITNGSILFIILYFHILKLIPLLLFGWIYLSRYKFRLSDFYNSSLIAILRSSHMPDNTLLKNIGSNIMDLSIIIPAYNEQERLPLFLEDVRKYIDKTGIIAEVLIVDDGSKDSTADIVENVAAQDSRIKLLKQVPNQGKGAAVKRGILASKGKFAIYADADGATPISELDKFLPLMMNNSEIIIGSRKAGSDEVDRSRKGIRALMGMFFYKIVNFFAVPGIQDTQCGFKMFRHDVAQNIFAKATEKGWAFDVELLYIAQLLGCTISEVPVNWHEVEGSKVNPMMDSLKMLVAIFRIRSIHGGFFNNK